ncbi:hypothetical protein EVC02_054 [Rhizobium phage RHph_N17]|nr:hypothetical protein EVC02_054 [Rhizobium phage RHph_N17]
MLYMKTLAKAVIPRKPHDIVIVSILTTLFTWAGFQVLLQSPPRTIVNAETTWPSSVPRGGFFYLNFDLTFDKSCTLKAKRIITASDGVEYLAQQDEKDVAAGERLRYTVTVPVSESLPAGPAFIRSQISYECDFWSRWIRNITQAGRARRFLITDPVQPSALELDQSACLLPRKPGFTVVRAHYRRVAEFAAADTQPPTSPPAKQ